MRKVRLKSGGHVNVYGEGEGPVLHELNFSEKEWHLVTRLAKNTSDPEAEKEFWKTIMEKKMADEKYSVFEDFPEVEGSGCAPGPSPTAQHPSADNAHGDSTARKEFNGADICRQIIGKLSGRSA